VCNIDAALVIPFSLEVTRPTSFCLWLTLRYVSGPLLLAFWRHRAGQVVGRRVRRMSSLNYMELCRLCLVNERVSIPIFEGEGDARQIFLKIASCLPVKVSNWSVTHAMSEIYWIAMLSTYLDMMAWMNSLFQLTWCWQCRCIVYVFIKFPLQLFWK
jgi:hypothetical protein